MSCPGFCTCDLERLEDETVRDDLNRISNVCDRSLATVAATSSNDRSHARSGARRRACRNDGRASTGEPSWNCRAGPKLYVSVGRRPTTSISRPATGRRGRPSQSRESLNGRAVLRQPDAARTRCCARRDWPTPTRKCGASPRTVRGARRCRAAAAGDRHDAAAAIAPNGRARRRVGPGVHYFLFSGGCRRSDAGSSRSAWRSRWPS